MKTQVTTNIFYIFDRNILVENKNKNTKDPLQHSSTIQSVIKKKEELVERYIPNWHCELAHGWNLVTLD